MDFSRYLTPKQILVHPHPESVEELLEALLERLLLSPTLAQQPELKPGTLRNAVLGGDCVRPTMLSHGILYPHARVPGMRGVALAIATAHEPMNLDGGYEGVRLAIMLVAPEEMPALALHFLAKIARFTREDTTFEALFELGNPQDVCSYLQEHLLVNDGALTAADIMRKPYFRIYPETPLREVTRMMLTHNLEAAGVVDHEDNMVGEITCDKLIMSGVPDFFHQLKSVSFISEYDPFERYFEQEAQQLAGTVMSTKFATLPETASLLEIVFELAVHHCAKIYIVREKKILGVIDRILLLDKILNL